LSEVVFGYTYPDGGSIGGPIIGRGKFMSTLTTYLNPDTGQGVPTIFHTFGATAVEVEVDVLTGEIEILRAAHAFDVGKAVNPLLLKGQIDGGFIMGQSVTLHEEIVFDEQGWVLNPNPTEREIREYLSGHICRCGTYKQMIEAILEYAKEQKQEKQIEVPPPRQKKRKKDERSD